MRGVGESGGLLNSRIERVWLHTVKRKERKELKGGAISLYTIGGRRLWDCIFREELEQGKRIERGTRRRNCSRKENTVKIYPLLTGTGKHAKIFACGKIRFFRK